MKKSKKVFIAAAIVVGVFFVISIMIASFGFISMFVGPQRTPQITEAEFPFVVEYEMNGETYKIEDTIICKFTGFDGMLPTQRCWGVYLKSGDEKKCELIREENQQSILTPGRTNTLSRLVLDYGSPEYYMGDPQGWSLIDKKASFEYRENWQVSEKVSDLEHTKLSAQELKRYFGIEIIRFEFSEPIKNKFK